MSTGTVYWEVPFEVDLGMTVPTPVQSGAYLLVSSIYNSARMLRLDDKPRLTSCAEPSSQEEPCRESPHLTTGR